MTTITIDVDVYSMPYCERPKFLVDDLWPSGLGVKKHSEGPSGYESNATFDDTIHMVSTSASDRVALTSSGKILGKFSISKDTIVGTIFLYCAMIAKAILLISVFALESFNGIGRFLKMWENVPSGNVYKEGASVVSMLRSATTHGVW